MEVEAIGVEGEEEERRLVRRRFEAAVKVIKSLPPDGERARAVPCLSLTRAVEPVRSWSASRAWSSCDFTNPLYLQPAERQNPNKLTTRPVSFRSIPAIQRHDAEILQLLQTSHSGTLQYSPAWFLGRSWQS